MVPESLELLSSLTEQEKSYYLLLESLRRQEFSHKEIAFVKNIAMFSSSPFLISYIICCEKWYHNPEIKEALSQNDILPPFFHNYLQTVLTAIELLKTLNQHSNNKSKKESIANEFKELIKPLKEEDKGFLKQLTLGKLEHIPSQLNENDYIKVVTAKYESVFLNTAVDHFPDLSTEEKILKSKTSTDSKELASLILDRNKQVYKEAIQNRYLKEQDLIESIKKLEFSNTLAEIYKTPRWFFRDEIRNALTNNPYLPKDIQNSIAISKELSLLFDKLSKLKRNIAERDKTTEEILELLKQTTELELQYITVTAKRKWPALLNIIKIFYKFNQDNIIEKDKTNKEFEHSDTLTESNIVELMHIAATTEDENDLVLLLQNKDKNVFRNILSNPNLKEKHLLSVIYKLPLSNLIILFNSKKWYKFPKVRSAMIHNPNVVETIALDIADKMTEVKDWIDVLRDKKVKSVDVKNICFSKLSGYFNSLSEEEKAKVIIDTKGEIFRELWGTIFKDESLLETLLLKFNPSEEIVLRIIHSRLTSLSILQLIAVKQIHFSNIAIVTEFFHNPKVNKELKDLVVSKAPENIIAVLKERNLI
jgi:hypothetical protein